ncbi:MAG: TA system VapC family ribonuclease toxin [Actinomycetes bacterium]
MTTLLDGNVLVALTAPGHVHSEAAHTWWQSRSDRVFATCPITQGTLLRLSMSLGWAMADARRALARLTDRPDHAFWPDDLSFTDLDWSRVVGRRQVTDAYLAALARHRRGRLATFDKGLAALHDDVADVIPTSA